MMSTPFHPQRADSLVVRLTCFWAFPAVTFEQQPENRFDIALEIDQLRCRRWQLAHIHFAARQIEAERK
jgi:hypothetical protein